MTIHTTLSRRGAQLAASESIRDKFGMILNDPYDPVKNPNGFVNMGVAENVKNIFQIREQKTLAKTILANQTTVLCASRNHRICE